MAASPWFEKARKDGLVIVEEVPKFDLELVESNYAGRTKIERLLHLGRISVVLSQDALVEAIKAAKQGHDGELYREAVRILGQVAPQDSRATPDLAWLDELSRKNSKETSRLEAELKGYKNNLLKESIRMAYDDTGKHNHLIGNVKEAEKAFGKEREFCQTPQHIAIMMFRLIGVYIDRKAWISVENNASKVHDLIRDTPDAAEQEGIISAITGLAQMSSKNFSAAADSFLDTNTSFMQTNGFFGESHESSAVLHGVISPSDVATYGALCALASMDRSKLKTRVLENANFRQFLEREPHLRRAISSFVGGKFSQCLTLLEQYRADYLLDMNLYPHFTDILERVRRKAVVQYLEPYSRVTFASLAHSFNINEDAIVGLLVELIQSGSLPSRLDMATGTIVRKKVDARLAAHEEAIETARAFESTVQQRCLRLEVILTGLEVKAPRQLEGPADTLMGAESGKGMKGLRQSTFSSFKS